MTPVVVILRSHPNTVWLPSTTPVLGSISQIYIASTSLPVTAQSQWIDPLSYFSEWALYCLHPTITRPMDRSSIGICPLSQSAWLFSISYVDYTCDWFTLLFNLMFSYLSSLIFYFNSKFWKYMPSWSRKNCCGAA